MPFFYFLNTHNKSLAIFPEGRLIQSLYATTHFKLAEDGYKHVLDQICLSQLLIRAQKVLSEEAIIFAQTSQAAVIIL